VACRQPSPGFLSHLYYTDDPAERARGGIAGSDGKMTTTKGSLRVEQFTRLLNELDEAWTALAMAVDDPSDLPPALMVGASLDLRRMVDTLSGHAAALEKAGKQARREAREARIAKSNRPLVRMYGGPSGER